MRSPMRAGVLLLPLIAACAAEPAPSPLPPLPIDTVWARTIREGDLIVLVPGTGSYDYLAASIEPLPGPVPVVDPRVIEKVADDTTVFEQAIGAAHRAGVDPATLTFGLWGAGFTKLTEFTYVSYEGLHIPIEIIGGTNTCATGLILENFVKYSTTDAEADATDLYARTQTWLAAHPPASDMPRNVIVASHSWGGVVAEYLAENITAIEGSLGPLTDAKGTAQMAFTIAAGVPAMIPNYKLTGPGLRDFAEGSLYEIDRPDDPVHALDPSGNGWGHHYVIMFGDAFQGAYGVTTEELSCKTVPGECPRPGTQ
jgi:hypothetical protein